MKVITLNLNGIRSAFSKGFLPWVLQQEADFICLQELKAQAHQLSDPEFQIPGYHFHYACAEKKGYSGVAIYSRHLPDRIITQLGDPIFDTEGRFIQIEVGEISLISLYLPSGSSGELRQQVKFKCLDFYHEFLINPLVRDRPTLICGDLNIAHRPIDLKNWRANQKNSGFLPEERAWMDRLLSEVGYQDAFRLLETGPEHYTWWSNRGQAWAKNVGWRIDYQLFSPAFKHKPVNVFIHKASRFSDHAPLMIEYE